jgi:hypothetical protein
MGIIGRQKGKYVIESLFRKNADGVTARAGGGKALATPLAYGMNRITIVATAADSVLLPKAADGAEVLVINDAAANAAQVFGAGTDTIDGVATATGVVLSAAKRAWFYCLTDGAWISLTGVKAT